ncbi:MAG: AEC family transporter [Hyphomicrobiaceae bacterium]|nr:AEC family transporter [Hyphomicrobiaceae bacterium]MCC0022824.1 AEC family transporter [Hyphomicrobiaceae bacterium]
MDDVFAVIGITFPVFAMVALGYALVAFRVFSPEIVRAFGQFVMYVALPAQIFTSVSSQPVSKVMDVGFLAAFALGSLATFAAAYVWFSFTTGPIRRSIAVLGSVYSNSSFIGYPLVQVALPQIAGVAIAMALLVEIVVIAPISFVILSAAPNAREAGFVSRIRGTAINLFRRPVVIATILAMALSASGLTPPGPVLHMTSILGNSAAALALLVIGGSVAGLPVKGNRSLATQIVVGKLLVHPAMTLMALYVLGAFGIRLEPEMQVAVLLFAAVPMLSIYAAIAHEVNESALASLAQIGAIVGSFFTLSLMLGLLV